MTKIPTAWQDYRKRRRRLLWAALAGLALFGASFLVAGRLHSAKPVFAGFALFLGATVLGSVAFSNFPCPKCGKPFIYTDDLRDTFTSRCVHCGLPKWSDPDIG